MGMPNNGQRAARELPPIPMPRMTNTYMLNGDDAPEDIIKSVKRGCTR
jgi:TldD protein